MQFLPTRYRTEENNAAVIIKLQIEKEQSHLSPELLTCCQWLAWASYFSSCSNPPQNMTRIYNKSI